MAKVASVRSAHTIDTGALKKVAVLLAAMLLLMAGVFAFSRSGAGHVANPAGVLSGTTGAGASLDEWMQGYRPGDDLSAPPSVLRGTTGEGASLDEWMQGYQPGDDLSAPPPSR
jgi:hypothetical protein